MSLAADMKEEMEEEVLEGFNQGSCDNVDVDPMHEEPLVTRLFTPHLL